MKCFAMDTCEQRQRGGRLCNCVRKEQLLPLQPFICYRGGRKRFPVSKGPGAWCKASSGWSPCLDKSSCPEHGVLTPPCPRVPVSKGFWAGWSLPLHLSCWRHSCLNTDWARRRPSSSCQTVVLSHKMRCTDSPPFGRDYELYVRKKPTGDWRLRATLTS